MFTLNRLIRNSFRLFEYEHGIERDKPLLSRVMTEVLQEYTRHRDRFIHTLAYDTHQEMNK